MAESGNHTAEASSRTVGPFIHTDEASSRAVGSVIRAVKSSSRAVKSFNREDKPSSREVFLKKQAGKGVFGAVEAGAGQIETVTGAAG